MPLKCVDCRFCGAPAYVQFDKRSKSQIKLATCEVCLERQVSTMLGSVPTELQQSASAAEAAEKSFRVKWLFGTQSKQKIKDFQEATPYEDDAADQD